MIPQYTYPAQQETFADRAREFFSFDGRVGRQTYWLRSLLLSGLNLVAIMMFFAAPDAGFTALPLFLAGGAMYLGNLLAGLATTVKRLHDRGRSGWFMLVALIPFVGLWVLIEVGFLAGDQTPNEYGDPV
jgi:uncharacterized membrane protein YhaH (DUF805 family)